MLKVLQDEKPWYADGLQFECTGCGNCCTGSPGYVWLNDDEIVKIAEYLKITVQEFSRTYLRMVKGNFSLLEHHKTYDCVFLKDNKCQIYPVRPTQCRTFPWWPKNLDSREAWITAAKHCEGIRLSAPINAFNTIETQKSLQQEELDKLM